MSDTAFLRWPFFDERHRVLASDLDSWAADNIDRKALHDCDVDDQCRRLVRAYGDAGWLQLSVPAAYGGRTGALDVRSLCVARETLARHAALADFAFAMQGLGAGPISLYGSESLRARYLPGVSTGRTIAAFALSEPEAGSDIAAMRTTARRDGADWVIDGEKTWISNGGIADFYVVFARIDGEEREFAAFVVEADAAGVRMVERLVTIAPHPLARIAFEACRVPAGAMVGDAGRGVRVALGTLDTFRATVGAAALGLARRALDEAVGFARERRVFGRALAEHQLTQARIAGMATEIDASALLVYRAAWMRDCAAEPVTREAAMAKWYATEAAQRVIDAAVQLHGGRGIVAGSPVEELYREIRSLRIYEGTSEVQQLVIASRILKTQNAP
ncbi:MAG: Acyl-CoA dehydrogenase [Gemmatimonadaceae bacterium]|nr:Acyl-CoA dehydrogenase [Gemmatimonadaceae bacterium]